MTPQAHPSSSTAEFTIVEGYSSLVQFRSGIAGRVDLQRDSALQIQRVTGIDLSLAQRIVELRSSGRSLQVETLREHLDPSVVESLSPFVIVTPEYSVLKEIRFPTPIYAKREFSLRFYFSKTRTQQGKAALLKIHLCFPSGRIFTEYYTIDGASQNKSYKEIGPFISGAFGLLQLEATLYDVGGHATTIENTLTILPTNPIQIHVSPSVKFPNAWRGPARYDVTADIFRTSGTFRIYNGTNATVTYGPKVTVKAWDGNVNGTLIDEWSFNLGQTLKVVANSYSAVVSFTNDHPNGSSSFDAFADVNDLTLEFRMQSSSGHWISGNAVWATMNTLGVNIIYVGTYSELERDDTFRACQDIASSIYEQWNLQIKEVREWWMTGSDVDKFRDINSFNEAREMFNDYSAPNQYLDVFMVETLSGETAFAGFSYVNVPTDKAGKTSGICIHKDPDILNLGQTFAHEIGHHLGLEHANDDDGCDDTDPSSPNISDNFIYSSSRRDSAAITFCQWAKMCEHGFVSRGSPVATVRRVAGWFGWENQGAALTIGSVKNNNKLDMVVLHVDNPPYENRAYYRIGWNIDATGNPDSWTTSKPVLGWFGWETQGGGVALGNISDGNSPDLVVFHIDNASGNNFGYYRIGWNLNQNGDVASWSSIKKIPGSMGQNSHGGGIALGKINNNSRPDLVIFWIEDTADENRAYYQIGWDLDKNGIVASWSNPKRIPGWFGWFNAGGDIGLADINGSGRPDLIVFHIDSPPAENRGYYRIGWNLDQNGDAASWSKVISVPGWFGWESQGGGVAVAQLGGGGAKDLVIFHIDNPNNENQGFYRIGWNLDNSGNPKMWR